MLDIKVCEIRGKCPVYMVGDRMTLAGPEILLDKTDAVYIHALQHYSIMWLPWTKVPTR